MDAAETVPARCRVCQAQLTADNVKAFRLEGVLQFYTCSHCAPVVAASAVAAGEGFRRIVTPKIRSFLERYPVLGAALDAYSRARHNGS